MLTKIVNTNEGYKVGDLYEYDDHLYIIKEIQTAGDLSRLYLEQEA